MITRARRALPTGAPMGAVSGLVVALLLAAPGLAGAAEGSLVTSLRTPQAAASTAIRPPPAIPSPISPIWTDRSGSFQQAGIASWYGGTRWQGKLTASGVRYDENRLTAAHASLPIGSRVRVTVADSGRSVIVTINDRPGTRKRIIDLSRAAAIELGILNRGLAPVSLTSA